MEKNIKNILTLNHFHFYENVFINHKYSIISFETSLINADCFIDSLIA